MLAVADAADEAPGFVQRVDAGRPSPGPAAALARGEHVVAAFDDAGRTRLVTSERGALCVSSLDAGGLTRSGCARVSAHALVAQGDALLLLRTDAPPPPEEEPPPNQAPQRRATRKAEPAPKPRPTQRTAKPARPTSRDEAVRRVTSSGRELAVYAQRMSFEGALEAEPLDTELRFTEPMSGLGLIGAHARGERVELVFYEASSGKSWRAPPGFRAKRPAQFGRFGLATLDEELRFDATRRKAWGESPLEIGFLSEHVEPRLVEVPGGAVLLGQRSFRGKCDATVVSPFVMPMLPDPLGCALAPSRFVVEARARHAGDPVEHGAAPNLELARASRAPHQPSWDVGRAVLGPTRGFTLIDGALYSFAFDAPAASDAREATPLSADRLRIHWTSIDVEGQLLASTSRGLITIDAAGQRAERGRDAPWLRGPTRGDTDRAAGRAGARIGARWWLGRGELGAVGAAPSEAHPLARIARAADDVALLGGASEGRFLVSHGASFDVHALAEGGASRLVGALAPSPFGPGLEAVGLSGGRALVVGPRRGAPGSLLALPLDAAGRPGAPRPLARPAPLSGRPLLAPTPEGVVVVDASLERATWLSPEGAELAEAGFPAGRSEARCLDGVPAPRFVPSPAPGRFVEVPELGRPGHCAVGAFAWSRDGHLSWVVSRVDGASAHAELWRVRGLAQPAQAHTSPTSGGATSAPAPRRAPCPPEMVSIAGRYCVDRFEGSLAHRSDGRLLSPDYPPTPNALAGVLADWSTKRERGGDLHARALPLPPLDPSQIGAPSAPVALSRRGLRPSSYVSGLVAREACAAAGKRLCTHEEWRTACRGEKRTRFPYGDAYEDGTCNVNRPHHPAAILHGHASVGHLDPRLVRVEVDGEPLLRLTGASPRCLSRWGDDAVFDMVGNLDEWVDHEGGAFAGGFFARGTSSGCDALVDAHPEPYLDYTTGLRCCLDTAPAEPSPPRDTR